EFRKLQLTVPRRRRIHAAIRWILEAVARRRATAGAGWWEAEPETLRLNLNQTSASGRPGRRCRPRLRNRKPVAADFPAAALVADDTTICPPWAAAQRRAVVWTARPMYPTSVSVGWPL